MTEIQTERKGRNNYRKEKIQYTSTDIQKEIKEERQKERIRYSTQVQKYRNKERH